MAENIWIREKQVMMNIEIKARIPISFTHAGAFHAAKMRQINSIVRIVIKRGPPSINNLLINIIDKI